METIDQTITSALMFGSYRTYEEWKLIVCYYLDFCAFGSYRTYEEWKPTTVTPIMIAATRSYRTYEEWKPLRKS